ncbi:hypothetical protein PILCRDRAFT_60841 [Piloderma croceum F 1598]|uniref:CHAT domain-containing protein n=1 Tax=Piloderma croceum (strain F 1598) TaxID=765440 RepID=A0A0C3GCI7_PILCF|nr:hypothetical protein PILCRDRAFT_60841 [Piloderma croceum F 1598]
MRYFTLGVSQLRRFERSGEHPELENAITSQLKAVEYSDAETPNLAVYLSHLSDCQMHRFDCLDSLADLVAAVSNEQKAVDLTGGRNPIMLSNLGCTLLRRFERLGVPDDLDSSILNCLAAVEHTAQGDPDKPLRLSNLGTSQMLRYERYSRLPDLEMALSNHEHAVKLTNYGHPAYLSHLGHSLHSRFERLGLPDDLEGSIVNFVTAAALADDRHPEKPDFLSNLGGSLQTRFLRRGNLDDLENAIINRQKAVDLASDHHRKRPMYLMNLGICQENRFQRLGQLADIDNAISNHQMAIELTHDGHPNKPGRLSNLGTSLFTRFRRLGFMADLENAISIQQSAVDLTDDKFPDKRMYLSNLGSMQYSRFEHLRKQLDLNNAISNLQMAVDLTPDDDPKKLGRLSNLGNSQYHGEPSDLENAISNQRSAVELTDDGHPNKPGFLSNLSCSQRLRFERQGQSDDLENAISNEEKAIMLTGDEHPHKAIYLSNLGKNLHSRFRCHGDQNDLEASIDAAKAAAQLKSAHPHQALAAARSWAQVAHENGKLLSALDGYRAALEILPKVAWLGLDASSHHHMRLLEKSETLGCLAATCAIQLDRFGEAAELLDLCRSVFWQQASSLRSDLKALKGADPKLADELESIGRKLDADNLGSSAAIIEEQYTRFHRSEAFGKERRRLAGVWEGLLERVRLIPKFKYFLKPVPFQQLRQSAASGEVVIINISGYGADALIFGVSGPIEHVPLPKINIEKLTKIVSNVMLNRSADARSPEHDRAAQRRNLTIRNLQNTLRVIWRVILVPIFDKMRLPLESYPGLPQRRIWWYPTGPLTFIPIHAAGPDKGSINVSCIVISSYVTTLSALFEAQKTRMSASQPKPKLLAISQPETPGQARIPQSTPEVLKVIEAARSASWSGDDILHLHGSDATVDRVLEALDTSSWIHFACHGSQDPIMGTKSAFALHDGHLKLDKIASKRLSVGQFAFLSACHTASGLRELPGEAMHLAAGLQFSGFQSVIATMWGISDDDAPRVADDTYRYLFRNGIGGLDPSDAATALSRAVLRLREDPKVTLDRWAPFVHFGI